MGKPRTALFLWICLLILGCLLPLPHIAAALQDSVLCGFPAFSPVQASPDLQTAAGDRDRLSPAGKISLAGRSLYPITPEALSRTHEEAVEALEQALSPYFQAGLLEPEWEMAQCTVASYIAYGINNNSCTLWEACLLFADGDARHSLHLYLDDATGNILSIDCQTGFPAQYPENSRQDLALELARLYLAALDPETAADLPITSQEPWAPDAVLLQASLSDALYGEVPIHFCVYENGFYVNLPVSQ